MNKNTNNLRKEINRLRKIPGNVRGVIILSNSEYVRHRKGNEGLEMVENTLRNLEVSFSFDKISPTAWYPEWLSVAFILTSKEVFNWKEEDIFDMGLSAPKLSLFIRMLVKYFASPIQIFKEAPVFWRRHFDFGELEPVEIDENKRYFLFRIKGYEFHPLICYYHKGYFLQVARIILGTQDVKIQETKCVFRGDLYHEYLIKW